jgi:N-glycosylase/DNA lyase
MTQTLFLDTPANFSFRRTIFSHGWCELLPFEIDKDNWHLSRVFTTDSSEKAVAATLSDDGRRIKIKIDGAVKIDKKFERKILSEARHILRLDDDLSEFYELLKSEKRLAWIGETNAGRMLRSPTVFEDLVKTVCTTNCSWALTKKMTANLVEKLGAQTADGKRAFPTPAAMGKVSPEFYKTEMRAGYRAPFFAELAEAVASGRINPENWLPSDLPTKELKREIKQIKGVGEYAADNLLKLLGRYDGLALDSWLRSQFYKKHNGGGVCDDKTIEIFYEQFGAWRGLVMWCDMTERWFV